APRAGANDRARVGRRVRLRRCRASLLSRRHTHFPGHRAARARSCRPIQSDIPTVLTLMISNTSSPPLIERLRETTALLEAIAADGRVLHDVPDADRQRLLEAVARVYHPDRVERRRMAKKADKARKAARVSADQGTRADTGIQTLRSRPVFHSPN